MPAFSAPSTLARSCFGGLSRQKSRAWLKQEASPRERPCLSYPKLSIVNSKKTNVDQSNGAVEPARVLLERLFRQTQKLEQKMNKNSAIIETTDLSSSLEVLESDIQAALQAMKRREEGLHSAESKILFDQAELTRAKIDLDRREQLVASSLSNQKKMEQELRQANANLELKAKQIGDLRLLVEEQRWKALSSQATLSAKENEISRLRNELIQKNKEIQSLALEIESRDRLLSEANKVIAKQEGQLREMQRQLQSREDDLAKSLELQKNEEEKLRLAEAKLEKMSTQWLLSQTALKQLAEEAAINSNGIKEATADFTRVCSLLSDVKCELISSQRSIASSRISLQLQSRRLEEKRAELDEECRHVLAHSLKLEDAQAEVQRERTELGGVVGQRDKLRVQLLYERTQVGKLEADLQAEKRCLEEANKKIDSLQRDLQQKTLDFNSAQELLRVTESELDVARVLVKDLRAERASIELYLREKNEMLMENQRKLAELGDEIAQLRELMKVKDDLLMQANGQLQDRGEEVLAVRNELHSTKLKLTAAAMNIEQISQLTDELVVSVKIEGQTEVLPGVDCSLNHLGSMREVEEEGKMTMREAVRIQEVEKELTNLLSLTDKLLKDAGIRCQ
ncbi:protein involved in starch initiation 1-like [Wolffia australiana]